MKKIFFFSIFIFFGCSDSRIITDPEKILPVYQEAIKCCNGNKCNGSYKNLTKDSACKDVQQFELCLKGVEEECPLRGHGAF